MGTSTKRHGDYKRKWNTDVLRKFIKDNNIEVELLSEYTDMYTKMKFRCKCGNIFETSLHEFNNKKFPKRQCNQCGRKKPNGISKITCDYIRKFLIDNSYTCKLLSATYHGCDEKLLFECECGKAFYASWSNIKHMKGYCKECSFKFISNDVFINRLSKYLDMFEIIDEYKKVIKT